MSWKFLKKMKFTGVLTLVIVLMLITKIYGQGVADSHSVIEGSDKITKFTCKDNACTIQYPKYTVTTKPNEMGEDIDVTIHKSKINKSEKKLSIKASKDKSYNPQSFNGLYGDFVIIDFGTSALRTIYIYGIKDQKIINMIASVNETPKIIDGKLYCWPQMSDKKIEKLKLKKGEVKSEGSGFYEEINYDFKTNKIIPTGKNKWVD
jgi:hypothetical protein